MKSKQQIKSKLYKKNSEWRDYSQVHVNSKESKIKGYVTEEEHLTGERLSRKEGWMYALEWVLGMTDTISKASEGKE